ncbi:ABC transporter permease [Tepidimicrobium xylanilyticum]|uniref:Peptide/nickel transport system permease protein n=1 Tax=Tepidimicrobium xylanilyticum TaxID=1123352 RepID=A0A1H3BQX2_9FIRM|nr:ABC transporter permease [Tepidimicrobium xylanilyticum]GMG97226.1 cytochrome c550 [Tepidimicrobium xylanilyticum]SDX44118.1 peptide/nickel transport system permease protein [Tepidimicrobium xylanilyticum]
MKSIGFKQSSNGRVLKKTGFLKPSTRENMKIYWYKFSRNKLSVTGLIIVLTCIILAIFAEYVTPYPEHSREFVDFANARVAPNSRYWFGTDVFGRDVFTRVIFSFRGALKMPIVVLAISVPIGTLTGLLAGYYNGTWISTIIMRITDIFVSIPPLVLALSIASLLEPNMTNSMIAVTVSWWPWYTRLVYGNAASIKNEYFVKNAELIGASKFHILFKEILPNCLSPIFTKMALDVGWVILQGASLSFVGLGEQPPTPDFGQMISDGAKYMPDLWWTTIFPALGIVFIILGFNFLGDGIRDMLDKGR